MVSDCDCRSSDSLGVQRSRMERSVPISVTSAVMFVASHGAKVSTDGPMKLAAPGVAKSGAPSSVWRKVMAVFQLEETFPGRKRLMRSILAFHAGGEVLEPANGTPAAVRS